jgi:SAM-dependent methyltransferase
MAQFALNEASAARLSVPILVAITLRDRLIPNGSSRFYGSDVVSRTALLHSGTGTAARRLLDLGANPLIAIEPDTRLATYLRETIRDEALRVIFSSFEEVALKTASFDLGVSATAFHWLNENMALTRIAELLRPGGRCRGGRAAGVGFHVN